MAFLDALGQVFTEDLWQAVLNMAIKFLALTKSRVL
jgi:hypothetical protein